MKKKWFVMVFMMLVLTACDQDCNPNGPDMPAYVTANGVYERVYTITHPNDNQPAQVAFEMEGGGRVWNATQVSEGNYTFSAGNRLATYPNGAHYEIYFFDPKVETTDRESAGRKITINGYTFVNSFMSGDREGVRCRFDEQGNVYEIF